MRDCAYCLGLAKFTPTDFQRLDGHLEEGAITFPSEEYFDCDECSGTGRMTLFFRYYFDFRYPRSEQEGQERRRRARDIRESRQSTP